MNENIIEIKNVSFKYKGSEEGLLNNISLSEGRPAWADECSHCMACYANCPTGAIEYGDITVGKPRYRFLQK